MLCSGSFADGIHGAASKHWKNDAAFQQAYESRQWADHDRETEWPDGLLSLQPRFHRLLGVS